MNKPDKQLLLQMLRTSLEEGILRERPFVLRHREELEALMPRLEKRGTVRANVDWLILCLAAVAGPEHEVFQTGYVPP